MPGRGRLEEGLGMGLWVGRGIEGRKTELNRCLWKRELRFADDERQSSDGNRRATFDESILGDD